MKTSSAKAKGRRLQNLLVEKLRALFPSLQDADIRPALMGESGMDVKLSTAARQLIPYGFESKNVEALNIWSAIAQAEANARSEKLTPAVIFSRNRMPEPYVAIPLTEFLRLIAPKIVEDTHYDEMMRRSHKPLDKIESEVVDHAILSQVKP